MDEMCSKCLIQVYFETRQETILDLSLIPVKAITIESSSYSMDVNNFNALKLN